MAMIYKVPAAAKKAKTKTKRRPLTDQQRNIRTAEGSAKRHLERKTAHQTAVAQIQGSERRRTIERQAALREEGYGQVQAAHTKGYIQRRVAGGAIDAAQGPIVNPILLVIFFIIGLSLFYLLVTMPTQTEGLLGRSTAFLTKLSRTTPLFTIATKGVTPNG